MVKVLAILILTSILLAGAVQAATVIISPGQSIQSAVNSAGSGGTTRLHTGTYVEGSIVIPSGSAGAHSTLIAFGDGPVLIRPNNANLDDVILLQTGQHHITLDGLILDAGSPTGTHLSFAAVVNNDHDSPSGHDFTIQNCEVRFGRHQGLHIAGNAWTLINNHIHHNGADIDLDHGVYFSAQNSLVKGNTFDHNACFGLQNYSSTHTGGDITSNNTYLNNTFTANGCGWVVVQGRGHFLANNLTYADATRGSAGPAAFICCGANSQVYHNTIANNVNSIGMGPYTTNASSVQMRNNIVCGNSLNAAGAVVSNNLTGSCPAFVNAGAGNYHLATGSAAINTVPCLAVVPTDHDGVTRPQGSTCDSGAYEFTSGGGDTTAPTIAITSPTSNATFSTSTTPIALAGTASDNVGVTSVTWTNDRGGSGTATGTTSWAASIALQTGTNVLTVTAHDAAGHTAADTLTVTFTPAPPPGGGALAGSFATPASLVVLPSEGTTDWAHWGLTTPSSFDHKAGGTPQISNITKIGAGSIQRLTDNLTAFSWSGGTPTASATSTITGIWGQGLNNGFQITASADTVPRTLRVYLGLWKAQGQVQASLSNGSASSYTDTSFTNTTGTSNRVYTFTYTASASGQTLTVKYTVLNSFDPSGNVTLEAATLQGAAPDTEAPTAPTGLTATVVSASQINLSWTASTDNVGVTGYRVERCPGAGCSNFAQIATTTVPNSPDTGLTPGTTYGYRVRATDAAGNLSPYSNIASATPPSSPPGGGSLAGSFATSVSPVALPSEGTTDWAHWGLTTPSSFDHKAGGTPQISNITKIGSNSINRLADNPTAFSWSGGTPTASATSTRTGIWIQSLNNGFQITAPADMVSRTLRVYLGLWKAQGQVQASLSDGSAPSYTNTSFTNTAGTSNRVYTFTYTARASGQTLTVRYTVLNSFDPFGNVTLEAATLASP